MKFYFSIGVSGSGKSTFFLQQLKEKGFVLVEPDQIRKEMGDINDQSRGAEVFAEAYKRASENLVAGKDVYFSATSLGMSSVKDLVKLAEKQNANVTAVVFRDSEDWQLCLKRVKEDLNNKVERSNTDVSVLDNATGEERPLIQVMSEKFVSLTTSESFKNYIERHNVNVIDIRS